MPTESTPSDEQLVERAQRAASGDLRAFESLVERHQASIKADCHYLTGSPAEAEDLAQEVFIKAFFGLSRFEGRSKFKTWLQRVKVNHCLNFIKKWKGKTLVDVSDPGIEAREELRVEAKAERRLDAEPERARISRVLEALSDSLRIPLVMRDMDDLSYQEIADELGIGLSAVKMRIKRGREEFRHLYQLDAEGGAQTAAGAEAAGRSEVE
jgi:RNA polymerase sigma-70 factor (ECF subfamily)